MREILFRGKDLATGEWVYGDLYHRGTEVVITSFYCGHHIAVDPSTVGQFTGYWHKEGNRVFEGDVVKYYDLVVKKELTSCVEWWEDGFILQEIGGFNGPSMSLVFFGESMLENIGNIHDHPELLEVNEDG